MVDAWLDGSMAIDCGFSLDAFFDKYDNVYINECAN